LRRFQSIWRLEEVNPAKGLSAIQEEGLSSGTKERVEASTREDSVEPISQVNSKRQAENSRKSTV